MPDEDPSGVFEELDLMIHNMDTPAQEVEVRELLRGLPGVRSATLVQGGVLLKYNATSMNKERICAALQQAGYRAAVFQDSKSGETGRSSQ
jgi:hypothetical protein